MSTWCAREAVAIARARHGELILHLFWRAVGDGDDPSFVVEHAIRDERDVGGAGDSANRLLKRIGFQFGEADAGTVKHCGAVRRRR